MQKNISNPMICNFFYVFYVVYAILFILSLLFTLGLFTYSKKMGKMGIAMGFQALLTTALGGVLMLFYYLICDRALIEKFGVALTQAKGVASGATVTTSSSLALKSSTQAACTKCKSTPTDTNSCKTCTTGKATLCNTTSTTYVKADCDASKTW